MSIPIDSADVAEQREREEALAEAAVNAQQQRAAELEDLRRRCAENCKGVTRWLGHDDDGRPIPCPFHRQHLLHVPCHTCSTAYRSCAEQQSLRRGPCCDHCEHSRRTPRADQ